MARGLPYDSDEGRAYAAAITALMTGEAYAQSARIADEARPVRRLRATTSRSSASSTSTAAPPTSIDARAVPADLADAAARRSWDEALRARPASTATATARSPCSRRPAPSPS